MLECGLHLDSLLVAPQFPPELVGCFVAWITNLETSIHFCWIPLFPRTNNAMIVTANIPCTNLAPIELADNDIATMITNVTANAPNTSWFMLALQLQLDDF